MAKIPGLRSPYAKVGGLVYFGRMLDKVRLQAKKALPRGFNLGDDDWYFFDARCCRFVGVAYADLRKRVLLGGTDRAILTWAWKQRGGARTEEEIEIWNAFISKRGWRDGSAPYVEKEKEELGLGGRADIQTWFDLYDAEEGRKPAPKSTAPRPRRERKIEIPSP